MPLAGSEHLRRRCGQVHRPRGDARGRKSGFVYACITTTFRTHARTLICRQHEAVVRVKYSSTEAVCSTKTSPSFQSPTKYPEASRPVPPLQLAVSVVDQMIFSATLDLIFTPPRCTPTFTSGAFECPSMSVLPDGDPSMAKQLFPDSNEKYLVVVQLPVSPARTLHH